VTDVLLVGAHSFLARQYQAHARPEVTLRTVAHDEIDTVNVADYDCVVNFALHPKLRTEPYSQAIDIDLHLAERLAGGAGHFVMLSSRLVYGQEVRHIARETDAATGANTYGRNKAETERRIGEILAARCTILRLANIIGFEYGLNRGTFMAIMLDRLAAEKEVAFDVSPFVQRDFLPDYKLAHVLQHIVLTRPGGVFNVGSGVALEIGRIGMWVLEGFGTGSMKVTSTREHDPFVLDVAKLRRTFGPICSEAEIKRHCQELGERLRDE